MNYRKVPPKHKNDNMGLFAIDLHGVVMIDVQFQNRLKNVFLCDM